MHRTSNLALPSVVACFLALFLGVFGVLPSAVQAEDCVTTSGYWVVSTYGLEQLPGTCPGPEAACCLNVYHKACNGKLRKSSVAEMQQSLNPQAPTCVFVHGSFVDIDSSLISSHHTYNWLRQGSPCNDLNAIFFIWPSSDAQTILLPTMVVENGLKASHNGMYLASLIDYLPVSSPLCLIGHSHGARVVAAGLHYRAGGVIQGCARQPVCEEGRCIRAVFAAAAINHDWLNPDGRYSLALSHVDCLLNLVNPRDVALTLYPVVAIPYNRALAKTGITNRDERKLGPDAHKIHELNVGPIVGVRHVWSNYYSRPEVSRLISGYVYGSGKIQTPPVMVDARLDETDRELAEWTGELPPAPILDVAFSPSQAKFPREDASKEDQSNLADHAIQPPRVP